MEGGGALHILMVPWLAFGHLLPFLELSKSLARYGHSIIFLTTAMNIDRLPAIPPSLTPLITFLPFPLLQTEHLPPSTEATIDLPSDKLRPFLRKSFDSFAENLSDLFENRQILSLDVIIYDYAAYWIPSIAAKFRVPCAFFACHNAAALSFIGPPSVLLGTESAFFSARTKPDDFTVSPNWIPFPSSIVYRPFEARELFKQGVLPDASGVSESHRFGKSIEGCQMVLIRSCNEFESEWLQLLGKLYMKQIVPVGLLPPATEGEDRVVHAALDWLDKREPRSVVYAAFGSEVKLTEDQAKEIGIGLDLSGLSFVWGGFIPVGISAGERGMVCGGWVPQARILRHDAIGGFLTHAGWGSIVEGLSCGRAMVLLPMMFEQGLNARNLVEKGIGVEVQREEDGRFTGESIAKSLRLAIVEDGGQMIRARARDQKPLFSARELHNRYVRGVVDQLRLLVRTWAPPLCE